MADLSSSYSSYQSSDESESYPIHEPSEVERLEPESSQSYPIHQPSELSPLNRPLERSTSRSRESTERSDKIPSIDEAKLSALKESIKRSYLNVLSGDWTREKAQLSIGLLIDSLKGYEKEKGWYNHRIICVLPKCADMILLNLCYIIDGDKKKFYLSLVPHPEGSEEQYHIDDFDDPDDYQSHIPSTVEESTAEQSINFHCPYKDKFCCHMQPHHRDNCHACCLNQPHYNGDN